MNKLCFILLSVIYSTYSLSAQIFQEITTGPGYTKQSFVSLKNGTEKLIGEEEWDLAFTMNNPFGAGIFINESSGLGASANAPVLFYDARTTDFSITPNIDSLKAHIIYNDEKQWDIGALNLLADSSNPFDFGWGQYNPASHAVNGTRVYGVQLRNGQWKKFIIESLINNEYKLKYADLDGTNERSASINIFSYAPQKNFAYFSFATNEFKDLEPLEYDFTYQRYVSPEDAGGGVMQEYTVTGILSAPGVKVAEAKNLSDPYNTSFGSYQDSLSENPEVIGHGWKIFTGTNFVIPDDLAYFVVGDDSYIYRIIFVDFEGSSTGTAVFNKEFMGVLSNPRNNPIVEKFGIFPSPAKDIVNVLFETKALSGDRFEAIIFDQNGRPLMQKSLNIDQGLNAYTMDVANYPPGTYHIQLSSDKGQISGTFLKVQ